MRQLTNSNMRQPPDELSILTVDSNPKSNDITIIERTMVVVAASSGSGGHTQRAAHVTNVKSNAVQHYQIKMPLSSLSNNQTASSSAYNSESNSFLVQSEPFSRSITMTVAEERNEDEDEEKPITYDAEESM
jgi:hypothetical protein